MTKTSINLQDLRRKIYIKAKAEQSWRFWGLYVHVCKMETLQEAYRLSKRNNGAPGIDGVTFKAIEEEGVEKFLRDIQHELTNKTYCPMESRVKEIPKSGSKTRTLKIATIRDRVVQGALKLILEPIFESDFQEGSFGYRPGRTAHAAIQRVKTAALKGMTKIIDVDLKSYFDTVRHDILLSKIAKRVNDQDIMKLLKLILKSGGKRGVPQGGPLSPLASNIYLNEIDIMLEKAKRVTSCKGYQNIEYARWADDLIILVREYRDLSWVFPLLNRRLREELEKLDVTLNEEKTRCVDLKENECFSFLGFDFRRYKTKKGKNGIKRTPKISTRTKILNDIKEVFQRYKSQQIGKIIEIINPKLRGWVNYFRIGNSSKCFGYIRQWVEKKVRRHLMHSRKRKGFGWKRWSNDLLYNKMGLYSDYKIVYN